MPETTPSEPTHTWLITLQFPLGNGGFAVATRHGSSTFSPGSSREQAYVSIRAWIARQEPELRESSASLVFFSLEPYRL
ncbi:hypothetical protein ACFZDG_31000 [Kitasatospora xanthocidica]|uniref:hypothetical protein n=1 Tax=Kitasatospora xanthocidica TaxID=83382 RepID=UPI0036DFE336